MNIRHAVTLLFTFSMSSAFAQDLQLPFAGR